MSEAPDSNDDPVVVGVPPETPAAVRPSTTGLVTGPVDGEPDIVVAPVNGGGDDGGDDPASSDEPAGEDLDRTLEDAEGGIEGSLLDAPDDEGVAPI